MRINIMLKNINCLALALRNGKIERMLCIVVPVFNEEESLGVFYKELILIVIDSKQMMLLRILEKFNYQIIKKDYLL